MGIEDILFNKELDDLEFLIDKKISEMRSLINKNESYKEIKKLNQEINTLQEQRLEKWLEVLKQRNPKVDVILESKNCVVCKVLKNDEIQK